MLLIVSVVLERCASGEGKMYNLITQQIKQLKHIKTVV